MARIRTVKPEMAQDEDIAARSPWAQLLAVRILNHADDEGYFKAHPALVKAACFPLIDSVNATVLLQELSEAGYLKIFVGTDGKEYGHVLTFLKHQAINKPRPSKIKGLVPIPEKDGSTTVGVQEGSRGEWNGMEQGTGNGNDLLGDESPPDPQDEFFERLWLKRPPRAGNDPKQPARNALRARIKEGASPEEIEQGLERYAAFCKATGKLHTETVMRLSTFLGTSKGYQQSWNLPRQGAGLAHSNQAAIAAALGET